MSEKILSSNSSSKDESDLTMPFSTENICHSSPNSPDMTDSAPNRGSPQNQSTETLSEMSNSSLSLNRESGRQKYPSPAKHRYSGSSDYNGVSPNSSESNPRSNSNPQLHKNSLSDIPLNKFKRSTTENSRTDQIDKTCSTNNTPTGLSGSLNAHSMNKQSNHVFMHGLNSIKNIGSLNSPPMNPYLTSTATIAQSSLDSRSALAALSLAYSSFLTKGMGSLPMGLDQRNSSLLIPGTHCPPMNNKLVPNFTPPTEYSNFAPTNNLTRFDSQFRFKQNHDVTTIPPSITTANSKLLNEPSGINPMNLSSLMNNLMTENFDRWQQLQQTAFANNMDPHLLSCYNGSGCPVELSGTNRRKNATRETTSMLKAWLNEHRKNPYPTKGEKIMLALITKMSLTQVSTWFANARRRLKKENKVTWNVRGDCSSDNGRDAESMEDDDEITERDLEGMNGLESLKHFLLSEKETGQFKDSFNHLDASRCMIPEEKKSFSLHKRSRSPSDEQEERLNALGFRKRAAFDSGGVTDELHSDTNSNLPVQRSRKIWSLVEMAHDHSERNSIDANPPKLKENECSNNRLQSPQCWKDVVPNLMDKPLHNSSPQLKDADLLSETINKFHNKDEKSHLTDGLNNTNNKISAVSPVFANPDAHPINPLFSTTNLAAFYFYYQLQQQQQQQQAMEKSYSRYQQHSSPIPSHSVIPGVVPNFNPNKEFLREEPFSNTLLLPFLPDLKQPSHVGKTDNDSNNSNNNSHNNNNVSNIGGIENKSLVMKTQVRATVNSTDKL